MLDLGPNTGSSTAEKKPSEGLMLIMPASTSGTSLQLSLCTLHVRVPAFTGLDTVSPWHQMVS